MVLAEISDKVLLPSHALFAGVFVAFALFLTGASLSRRNIAWLVIPLLLAGLVGWTLTAEDVTLRHVVEAELGPDHLLNVRINYTAPIAVSLCAAVVNRGWPRARWAAHSQD
jgi:hypothetical protein